MANISFICPYCRSSPMECPEQLCLHVKECHQARELVSEKLFNTGQDFERWLNRVEESRCEGGILNGSSNGAIEESEFYILCSRKASPQAKRRRLEVVEVESRDTLVSCTAFLHVIEKMDGTFHVKYCLDHSNGCEMNEEMKETTKTRKAIKRRSQEEFGQTSCSSSAGSIRPFHPPIHRRQNFFHLPTMNRFITNRLDTAASSLKNLNQMISDLATDINNRLWELPSIISVYHPNEICST